MPIYIFENCLTLDLVYPRQSKAAFLWHVFPLQKTQNSSNLEDWMRSSCILWKDSAGSVTCLEAQSPITWKDDVTSYFKKRKGRVLSLGNDHIWLESGTVVCVFVSVSVCRCILEQTVKRWFPESSRRGTCLHSQCSVSYPSEISRGRIMGRGARKWQISGLMQSNPTGAKGVMESINKAGPKTAWESFMRTLVWEKTMVGGIITFFTLKTFWTFYCRYFYSSFSIK